MTILFLFLAGIIPLVPLLGARTFKHRHDVGKMKICYILFAMQIVLSTGYIVIWFHRF